MKTLNLNEIDTDTIQGRYLMAAIAIITTECHKNATPDHVLDELNNLQQTMYEDRPLPQKQ